MYLWGEKHHCSSSHNLHRHHSNHQNCINHQRRLPHRHQNYSGHQRRLSAPQSPPPPPPPPKIKRLRGGGFLVSGKISSKYAELSMWLKNANFLCIGESCRKMKVGRKAQSVVKSNCQSNEKKTFLFAAHPIN